MRPTLLPCSPANDDSKAASAVPWKERIYASCKQKSGPLKLWDVFVSGLSENGGVLSMAGVVLCGGGRVPKDDVADEGADGDCDHDPAVVSHEDEPGRG